MFLQHKGSGLDGRHHDSILRWYRRTTIAQLAQRQHRFSEQANHYSGETLTKPNTSGAAKSEPCIETQLCVNLGAPPHPSVCLSHAAEKVSSLGKDWHKLCLKCDRCNKLLNAGGHAEVSMTPSSHSHGCF